MSVLFGRQGYGDLTGAVAELCTRGACAREHLRNEDITNLRLSLPDDVNPDSGLVRFRVIRKGEARPVIDRSADVRLTRQSDGCGSGAYGRGLAFTKDKGLTTKIPKSLQIAWGKQVREQAAAMPTRRLSPFR
ncbi:hypothetical protein [Streptomyces sp. NPDC058398]|uniref:hypothetical protein n=1 Tax=Streptomyces sp. NPDC058398 TaxID=3346479 RepID=UPI0036579C82